MNLTKLAKGGLIVSLLGAIAVGSVAYSSKGTDIKGFIDDLRAKALEWKGVAEQNKAEYNKLKAVYDEMLKLLSLDEGATYEQIVARIENVVKNTDVAGIDNTNNLLEAIADSLGVKDQLVKDENGVYNPQPIYDALKTLENDLDTAIAKIGDTKEGINTKAKGEITYREDMTLVEKINYLIAQVNNANDDQIAIKEYANEAVNGKTNESGEVVKEAIASPTDEDKVTSPVEKPKDETKPSNPGGVQGNAKTEAYNNLSDNAKLFADKRYEAGDIVYSSSDRVCKVVNNASKYGELIITNPVTGGFLVSSNNSLTADDITDLDNWANL